MQWSVKKKLISVVAIVTVNGYGGEILRVNGWVNYNGGMSGWKIIVMICNVYRW